MSSRTFRPWRGTALLLASTLALSPLAACNTQQSTPPPPVDDTRGGRMAPGGAAAPVEQTGMSTKKKVVILAGAAALYYLYKRHKNAAADQTGANSQYYLSKNGRVYYRDADHRAHWVTAPAEGIQVPAEEATDYQQFQGYDNGTGGRDLTGLGTDPE